jgi:hypothetical protein
MCAAIGHVAPKLELGERQHRINDFGQRVESLASVV